MSIMVHGVAPHHGDFRLMFKAVFGFAIVALVVVGAITAGMGHSLSFLAGLLAGLAGAGAGFVVARRVGAHRPSR